MTGFFDHDMNSMDYLVERYLSDRRRFVGDVFMIRKWAYIMVNLPIYMTDIMTVMVI